MEPGGRAGSFSSLHACFLSKKFKIYHLKLDLSLGMFIRISEGKRIKGFGAAKTRIE